MHAAKRHARGAALLSKHGPTCRRVAQSLGAAGLHVRATPFPSSLPIDDLTDVVALLVDLDVSPTETPRVLLAEARAAYPDVEILATAGIDCRARLLDALCESDVNHVIPKRGALTLPRGGMPVLGSLEGPDEHDLFAAVRRLLDGPESPGVTPYLLAGAPVHEASVRTSDDKDRALEQIVGFAESMDLGGEKLRRVELATEELLMNALYDAPRNADGGERHASQDRRLAVALGSDETVHMRYGCDGQTLAVAVADPFGSLTKRAVTERLRKVRDGIPKPNAGVAGAGLGLVMTYSVANQLIFSVSSGRLTEVTAVLHVGGSNRAAQERGTAVHFYVGGAVEGSFMVIGTVTIDKRLSNDGTLHVTIAGKIDERFEPAAVIAENAPKIVMHLGGVRSISSLGVRAFAQFMHALPQEVVLIHISPAVSSQLAMIPNLMPPNARVETAKLPFVCPACGAEKAHSVPFKIDALVEHAPLCSCGVKMELDGLPEQYLPT